MRRLSKALASKRAAAYIDTDLTIGTPPHAFPSTLAEASLLEEEVGIGDSKHCNTASHMVSEPKTSFSDDTVSTFSCVGDLLPDETAPICSVPAVDSGQDLLDVKRSAPQQCPRRNLEPSSLAPDPLDMFDGRILDNTGNTAAAEDHGVCWQVTRSAAPVKSTPGPSVQKQPSLMSKASGFFHRLRPQLNVDSSFSAVRRFSFEVGDDAATATPGTTGGRAPIVPYHPILRKSASMSSILNAAPLSPMAGLALFSVPQSPPTSSPPSEPRRVSRIPTPVRGSGSLARPRQKREDSSSSLLTAIRHSENTSHRSSSSSIQSSSSTSRLDTMQRQLGSSQTSSANLTLISNNRLLDHTKALRGNAFAQAAARAAVAADQLPTSRGDLQKAPCTVCPSRGSNTSTTGLRSDMSDTGRENWQPITDSLFQDGEDSDVLQTCSSPRRVQSACGHCFASMP